VFSVTTTNSTWEKVSTNWLSHLTNSASITRLSQLTHVHCTCLPRSLLHVILCILVERGFVISRHSGRFWQIGKNINLRDSRGLIGHTGSQANVINTFICCTASNVTEMNNNTYSGIFHVNELWKNTYHYLWI
jgi:hypothetical protein